MIYDIYSANTQKSKGIFKVENNKKIKNIKKSKKIKESDSFDYLII